eukprot:s541_g12.t1
MARVMVSSFATDARLSNKVNLALTPLYILSHWCQNWTATSGDQLIFTVCSEGIILSFLQTYQQTAKHYDECMWHTEERTGGAAQRLLSVTCDAFVRLAPDLSIFEPSRSLLERCEASEFDRGLERLDTTSILLQAGLDDMRHILGYKLQNGCGSVPSRQSRSSGSHSTGRTDNLTRLRNLEKVSIVVDVQRLGPSEVLGGSLRDVKSIGFG